MNKTTIIILMILLVLPIVAAEPSYFFKKDSESSLNIFCFQNNNSLCSGSSCKISIFNPDQTPMVVNESMTENIGYFNYTINDTSVIGEYYTIVVCTGDEEGFSTFTYAITIDGDEPKTTDSTTSISITVFLLLIAATLFFFGFKNYNTEHKYLIFIFKRSALVIGFYFMTLVSAVMANFSIYANLGVNNEMFLIMEAFGWVGYVAMVILVVGSLIQLLNEMKQDKQKSRVGEDIG